MTARSHGQIRIEPVWEAAAGTDVAAGWDQVVARQVVNGPLDMGMIPSRAWDTEKVTSLRALQAPFLVNTDALLKQVVTADMAVEMLAGLDRAGVTGLALVPESTRQIFAFGKPLLSPADLKGKTIRVPRSDTSYALFRALGATPSDSDALEDQIRRHRILIRLCGEPAGDNDHGDREPHRVLQGQLGGHQQQAVRRPRPGPA